jgi:hypothetical protein
MWNDEEILILERVIEKFRYEDIIFVTFVAN